MGLISLPVVFLNQNDSVGKKKRTYICSGVRSFFELFQIQDSIYKFLLYLVGPEFYFRRFSRVDHIREKHMLQPLALYSGRVRVVSSSH
ncbi:hypothetical protein ABKN59_000089 [Abortiporus biennis]